MPTTNSHISLLDGAVARLVSSQRLPVKAKHAISNLLRAVTANNSDSTAHTVAYGIDHLIPLAARQRYRDAGFSIPDYIPYTEQNRTDIEVAFDALNHFRDHNACSPSILSACYNLILMAHPSTNAQHIKFCLITACRHMTGVAQRVDTLMGDNQYRSSRLGNIISVLSHQYDQTSNEVTEVTDNTSQPCYNGDNETQQEPNTMPTLEYSIQQYRDKLDVLDRIVRQFRQAHLINTSEFEQFYQLRNSVKATLDQLSNDQQQRMTRNSSIPNRVRQWDSETHDDQRESNVSSEPVVVNAYSPEPAAPAPESPAMPSAMGEIKAEVYRRLHVENTKQAKRALVALGKADLLQSANLRTKAGWLSILAELRSDAGDGETTCTWRQMGIEIEFAPPHGMRATTARLRLQTLLENAGLSNWESELDCSCGNEIVSPIITSREQFRRELTKVLNLIREFGGRFTRKAGTHVHIDAEEYTGQQGIDISRRYYEIFDTTLRPMLMDYRDGNRYSQRTLPHRHPQQFSGSVIDAARAIQGGDRYRCVNLLAHISHDTIEYRQYQCLLNRNESVDSFERWVDTLQRLHQGLI